MSSPRGIRTWRSQILHDIFAAPTVEIPDAEVIESEGDIIILPSSNRPKAYNKLLKLATRVFENKDQATLWLYERQFGLNWKRPIDHMRTIKGAKRHREPASPASVWRLSVTRQYAMGNNDA